MAIPVGMFSAIKQYTLADFIVTAVGFLGLCTPGFLLALPVSVHIRYGVWGQHCGGLFSPEYVFAPWSVPKVIDLAKHIWVPPVFIIGAYHAAGMIRVMRTKTLDVLVGLHRDCSYEGAVRGSGSAATCTQSGI